MFIKIIMLVVFFAVTVAVGVYFRKSAKNVTDFVLGGRNVGPWITAFSFGTSYFSAVIFVGFAGQFGWRFGTAATWIGLGNAFIGSLLAWVILGRRTRVMTQHLKSATMPAFFGTRYDSNALKIGAAIIAFIFLIPYTASLYNGLSRLFEMAFAQNDENFFIYCIIGMAALTAVYVVAGGYLAQAVNDFIQGIIMLVGIVVVIMAILNDNGGLMTALESMARIEGTAADGPLGTAPGVFTSFFGPDLFNLVAVVLLTSLGTWGLPQMIARFYSIKSEKMIKKGAIVSTIFGVIVAGGCYFLGSFGRLYAGVIDRTPEGAPIFDSIVPKMLENFPAVLIGLVVLLVLAASMSTLSSLVIASSSTFTLDFLKDGIFKKMNEKKQVLLIRIFIVVFIAASAYVAIYSLRMGNDGSFIAQIAQLMGVSWGALAGSFLAPFLYGLYWKRASKISAWCCFIFSTVVMILNSSFRSSFPSLLQSPINAGAFCMLAGLVIVPLVSLITPKPKQLLVENCFACYDKTVSVKVKDDLGE